jgi:chemotaxis protein MotB
MAKKHKHPEHENLERWVISYADLVTLLFALFVVLYASSQVDNNKLAAASDSMRWALNFKGEGGITKLAIFKGPPTEGGCVSNTGSHPMTSPVQKQMVEALRRRIEKQLKSFLLKQETQPSIALELENGRLHIRLAAQRFFDPANASLRPESLGVLDAIGEEVASSGFNIRVEGHTDLEPVKNARYRNNWDLSAARAVTVVSYFEGAHAVAPERLTAAGLGSTRPMVSNDTPDGRELNRRIEIVLELPAVDPRGYAPSTP